MIVMRALGPKPPTDGSAPHPHPHLAGRLLRPAAVPGHHPSGRQPAGAAGAGADPGGEPLQPAVAVAPGRTDASAAVRAGRPLPGVAPAADRAAGNLAAKSAQSAAAIQGLDHLAGSANGTAQAPAPVGGAAGCDPGVARRAAGAGRGRLRRVAGLAADERHAQRPGGRPGRAHPARPEPCARARNRRSTRPCSCTIRRRPSAPPRSCGC